MSHICLALPLIATLLNVLFLFQLQKTNSQPVVADSLVGRCVDTTGVDCGATDLHQYLNQQGQNISHDLSKTSANLHYEDEEEEEEEEEEEPQLRILPGTGVKAYVRADIATFYGEKPGSRVEAKPQFNGQAGKFVNMSPDAVDLWWEGPDGPIFNDHVRPWAAGGTACYPYHKFIFTKPGRPQEVICRMIIVPGLAVYYCDPFAASDEFPADPRSRGMQLIPSNGERRDLSSLNAKDLAWYEAHVYNLEFGAAYKLFTGSEWLTMYPRDPPRHHIWNADFFGQQHSVTTANSHFVELPPQEVLTDPDHLPLAKYQSSDVLNLTLKTLSCAPRAFEIRNFLSDVEVDHILDIVTNRTALERSTTNGHLSSTRTSSQTWLPRSSDPILDVIYRRAADVLKIDEALLRNRKEGERPDFPTRQRINEDLQIVHYDVGQEYQAHHDFSMPKGHDKNSPSRSINLCMYLNDTPKGGETSFPRWRNAESGHSLDVKPEKGKAMIFYMITPDGNLDDLTQHAAKPVLEGEKYFANLWIHDPLRI